MKRQISVYEALLGFQQKARCSYVGPQQKARLYWDILNQHLPGEQMRQLGTAWSHVVYGEGPAELDRVCKAIYDSRSWAKCLVSPNC